MLISQNDQYRTRYKQLQKKISNDTRPLIITEGKSDWKHIKAAMAALDISDLDIDIYEDEDSTGDSRLKGLLENYSKISNPRKIIGIFDRDNANSVQLEDLLSSEYVPFGNNVYGFAIPLVNEEEYGDEISIEHY